MVTDSFSKQFSPFSILFRFHGLPLINAKKSIRDSILQSCIFIWFLGALFSEFYFRTIPIIYGSITGVVGIIEIIVATVCATSIMCSSATSNQEMGKFFEKILQIDLMLNSAFNIRVNYEANKHRMLLKFTVIGFCVEILNCFLTYSYICIYTPFIVYWIIMFPCVHCVHMQCFQIYFLMNLVEIRLELLLASLLVENNVFNCNRSKLQIFNSTKNQRTEIWCLKLLLQNVVEAVDSLNRAIGFAVLAVFLQIYVSMLVNIYWLVGTFLGLPNASVEG